MACLCACALSSPLSDSEGYWKYGGKITFEIARQYPRGKKYDRTVQRNSLGEVLNFCVLWKLLEFEAVLLYRNFLARFCTWRNPRVGAVVGPGRAVREVIFLYYRYCRVLHKKKNQVTEIFRRALYTRACVSSVSVCCELVLHGCAKQE